MIVEHGGDVYRNQIQYDFSVNINPLGMPENCRKAAIRGIELAEQYPDSFGEELVSHLAERKQLDEDDIILGNGAAELIYAFCQATKPKKAVTFSPSFSEYENAVHAVDGDMIHISLEQKAVKEGTGDAKFQPREDWVKFVTEEIDVVFLCNPNNPTGTLFSQEFCETLLKKCEETNTFLFVDECFLPFVKMEEDKSMLNYMRQSMDEEKCGEKTRNQLVVLRAFTKIYAMPGLRLGYLATSNEILKKKIHCQLQPWNTSIPAQLAGTGALQEIDYVEKTLELVEIEKQYLSEKLQALKPRVIDCVYQSDANFILLKSKCNLYKRLLVKKILIRDCSNFEGLEHGYYRIAIRTHEENEALINALTEIDEDEESE